MGLLSSDHCHATPQSKPWPLECIGSESTFWDLFCIEYLDVFSSSVHQFNSMELVTWWSTFEQPLFFGGDYKSALHPGAAAPRLVPPGAPGVFEAPVESRKAGSKAKHTTRIHIWVIRSPSDLPGLQTECCGWPHCYSMPQAGFEWPSRRAPAAALRRYEPFPPKPCQSQSHTKLQLFFFLFAAKFTPSPAQSNKQT